MDAVIERVAGDVSENESGVTVYAKEDQTTRVRVELRKMYREWRHMNNTILPIFSVAKHFRSIWAVFVIICVMLV